MLKCRSNLWLILVLSSFITDLYGQSLDKPLVSEWITVVGWKEYCAFQISVNKETDKGYEYTIQWKNLNTKDWVVLGYEDRLSSDKTKVRWKPGEVKIFSDPKTYTGDKPDISITDDSENWYRLLRYHSNLNVNSIDAVPIAMENKFFMISCNCGYNPKLTDYKIIE
ncbi:MAG: hypothetical protein JNL53_19620 [Cyclobacteriaceae bacterium]|nr:hypothetical protein [Cyclobacteriaceae bacterium]